MNLEKDHTRFSSIEDPLYTKSNLSIITSSGIIRVRFRDFEYKLRRQMLLKAI